MTEYTERDSGYTDNSPFVRVLRTEGRVRIIDAFLPNPEKRLTVSQLKDKTGMSRSALLSNLEELCEAGLIEVGDEIGGTTRYQVTEHNALPPLREAQLKLLTSQETRQDSPEPEEHEADDVSPLGSSFGEPPVDGEEIDPVDVELGSLE